MALPRRPKNAVWLALAIGLAIAFYFRSEMQSPKEVYERAIEMQAEPGFPGPAAEPAASAAAPSTRFGGPFSLIDQSGRAVTEADYRGEYKLIYFASTRCADGCVEGLRNMISAIESLGGASARIRPIFITTDPERDSIAVMARFAEQLDPRLAALTGAPRQIEQVARAYGVPYRSDETGAPSSNVFFMDPDGNYLTQFSRDLTATEMAARMHSVF